MNIEFKSYGSVEVVECPTELVMSNAVSVRKAVVGRVQDGREHVVFDLSNSEFVDSSGLAVLVSALKAARERGGEVVLLSPSDEVRSLIELTQLHKVFEIFEDRQASIKYLS